MSAVKLPEVHEVSELFRALGDGTRLRIVALLSHAELCVCHIQAALELSQPTVSRQLAVLRSAHVVECRREHGWAYYRLASQTDALRRQQLRLLVKSFGQQELLKRDVERLLRARGPGACR